MKWYKFKQKDGFCLEICRAQQGVLGGYTIGIGSRVCAKCTYNKGYDFNNDRIKCSKIKEATKK